MQVQLVSPERRVWQGEAQAVYARTTEGELGILPGHIPLIGTLVEGPVRIDPTEGEQIVAAVHGGFLAVLDSGVSVLGELVELAQEIDVARARQAYERASGAEDDDAQAAARRAAARLRAAGQDV
jgi:F-type H+-transporting ATPase subunit epsilon